MLKVIYFICSYLNFTRINSCPFKYFVLINCRIVYFYPCFLIFVFILSLYFTVLFFFIFYFIGLKAHLSPNSGHFKAHLRYFGGFIETQQQARSGSLTGPETWHVSGPTPISLGPSQPRSHRHHACLAHAQVLLPHGPTLQPFLPPA